jgi:hypothetical protein
MENLEAVKILKSFFHKMHDWELFCRETDKDNKLTSEQKIEKQKDEIIKIFKEYCTEKDRKEGRPNIIHYGGNGYFEYDVNEEKITNYEQINKNKIIIYTERKNPMPQRFQYTVINKNKRWLIDGKKKSNFENTKWINRSL